MKIKISLYIPIILPLVFVFFGISGISFNFTEWYEILRKFETHHSNYPQEKIYIHCDKAYYALGETLWFKAYIADSRSHLPLSLSSIIYVHLYDSGDSLVAERMLKNEGGIAYGDISISREWSAGPYTLMAYSQYMLNFEKEFLFQKKLPIYDSAIRNATQSELPAPDPRRDFDIQFFPESGDLVNGLQSKVAFKVINQDGLGTMANGKIVDQHGNQVAIISTIKFGHGSFTFTPEPDKSYFAEVESEGIQKKVRLPIVRAKGYVMHISPRDSDLIILDLSTNIENGLEGGVLFGHIRGNVFLTTDTLMGQQAKFAYNTSNLPTGIAHFTLFDAASQPVCERLVFLDNEPNESNLRIQTDSGIYGTRQKVTLEINNSNASTTNSIANLSVSVFDQIAITNDPHTMDIRSYLLLQSDLTGYIESPGYYFDENARGRELLLDLLMMTQGWRRFKWKNILEDQAIDINFPPESGFTISGEITRQNKIDESIIADVYINTGDEDFVMSEMTTGDDGYFSFGGFQFADTSYIVIQANEYDEKKKAKQKEKGPYGNRKVDIHITENEIPLPYPGFFPLKNFYIKNDVVEFMQRSQEKFFADSLYRDLWKIELESVTIEAEREKSVYQERRTGMLYPPSVANRVVPDSIPGVQRYTNVFELIRGRFPGVQVRRDIQTGQYTAYIRGGTISLSANPTPVQILLDGVPVDNQMANFVNLHNVAFVDVLKGLYVTSIYGAPGAAGVIAIWMKEPGKRIRRNKKNYPGVLGFDHPGYYQVREFYNPNYQYQNLAHEKPDYRTTLYWNPNVEIDSTGLKTIEFYTCDHISSYHIQVEGMNGEGNPVVGVSEFDVKN